jgi:hypothetical protein
MELEQMNRERIMWWTWLATAAALGVEMMGWPAGAWAAIVLTVAQTVYSAMADGRSFPLQVRGAYLVMLILGLWPPLFFLHMIQFVGTWALVLLDYCFLARCLSLLPWNRRVPLSGQMLQKTFFSRPVRGSFVESGCVASGQSLVAPGTQSTSLPRLAARAATKR